MSKQTTPGVLAIRVLLLLFGAVYLASAVNFYIGFLDFPIQNPIGAQIFESLENTGMYEWVKILEILIGISAFFGLFVPLMLVVSFPVTVMIAYLDIIVLGLERNYWLWGAPLLIVHCILLWAYLPYYRSMLALRASPSFSSTRGGNVR